MNINKHPQIKKEFLKELIVNWAASAGQIDAATRVGLGSRHAW
jgi:hypothetical protein